MFHHSPGKAWVLLGRLIGTGGSEIQPLPMQGRVGKGALAPCPTIQSSSFRGDAKHRTRNLEIPGLPLARHPGMTVIDEATLRTQRNKLERITLPLDVPGIVVPADDKRGRV